MSLSLAKRFETSVLLAVQVNREAGGDGSKGARVGVCSRLGRYVHLSPAAILLGRVLKKHKWKRLQLHAAAERTRVTAATGVYVDQATYGLIEKSGP